MTKLISNLLMARLLARDAPHPKNVMHEHDVDRVIVREWHNRHSVCFRVISLSGVGWFKSLMQFDEHVSLPYNLAPVNPRIVRWFRHQ